MSREGREEGGGERTNNVLESRQFVSFTLAFISRDKGEQGGDGDPHNAREKGTASGSKADLDVFYSGWRRSGRVNQPHCNTLCHITSGSLPPFPLLLGARGGGACVEGVANLVSRGGSGGHEAKDAQKLGRS